MQWSEASMPVRPEGRTRLHRVAEAYLSPVTTGRLRVMRRPDRWITGAVYDDGRLLRPSQRTSGLGGARYVMADPDEVAVPRGSERLRGTWLYGGQWMAHFGHFLTETLTTLWPERAEVGPLAGVVFHRALSRETDPTGWQTRLLELAAYGDLPVRVVSDEGLRVEDLLVPTRQVVLGGFVRPRARAVWRRIAERLPEQGSSPERVFLSRTHWHEQVRATGREARAELERDHMLDEVFAARGFRVVAPETLPIEQQVLLARDAEVVAGCAGSALHLTGFAPSGLRVVEVSDARTHDRMVPMQQAVDAASGHLNAWARHGWDRERLEHELDELDLAPRAGAGRTPTEEKR